MTACEAARFEAMPMFAEALLLRTLDDEAKVESYRLEQAEWVLDVAYRVLSATQKQP